jgi:hypothetical protein
MLFEESKEFKEFWSSRRRSQEPGFRRPLVCLYALTWEAVGS